MKLPGCNSLFKRFCAPWYEQNAEQSHALGTTRGDLETRWKPGTRVDRVHRVSPGDWRAIVKKQISTMVRAASSDWKRYLDIGSKVSLGWVEAFDAYYDRSRIRDLIERSDPKESDNEYHVVCIQFGVVLGTVLSQMIPRLRWLLDWPYWESAPYDSKTGTRVNVFHWAVDKLSEDGVDDGFAVKLQVVAQLLERELSER